MASITKISLLLGSVAIARLVSATNLYAFPNKQCDKNGYYDTIYPEQGTCTMTITSGDDNFQNAGNSSTEFQAWFQIDADEDDGCGVIIAQGSTDANDPSCGECILLIHKGQQCTAAEVPEDYYTTECCGQACMTACGMIPGKRSVGVDEAVETVHPRDATPSPTKPDIANLKNRSPISSAPLSKRSDCKFIGQGELYSQAGTPVKASDTINCQNADGCPEMYSATVEKSFSNTFGVMESTEAGFFDIVSETISFSYSATWESSQSVTVTNGYNYQDGQSGYMTFTPLSQCTLGTFSGTECGDIPVGGDARAACVPETVNGGAPNGDVNIVTVA